MVRRFYAAYNARDVATLSELAAPDFQFRSVFVGVEGRVYGGPDFTRYFDDLGEAWEHFWLELEDVLDAGQNLVSG